MHILLECIFKESISRVLSSAGYSSWVNIDFVEWEYVDIWEQAKQCEKSDAIVDGVEKYDFI